ncbi:Fructosamine kinase-domain-containing protein [Xylariaceae sp. FL0255]|nr:Fructosamine kinase-domain-containing protein [Xylariaceae sp. FL0255]
MDFSDTVDPVDFVNKIVKIHEEGISPNRMLGFNVPTVIGRMQRTVTWEKSWAASFTHQLKNVLQYDIETNGAWDQLSGASSHLIDKVIPRLLGALQSEGRSIDPVLVHGDLWERNVGIDMETGESVLFDPGCTYAHNEMEFGTWRCSWAIYLNQPIYMRLYQQQIPPSEPADEWDDRNRLYGIYQCAYNDMLYLCEHYAPSEDLEKYDPEQDVRLSGLYIPVPVEQFV